MHPNRVKPSSPLSTLDQTLHETQLRITQMPNDILKKLNNSLYELSHFLQTLPTIQAIDSLLNIIII